MSHGHIDIPRWKEFQHRDATRTDSAVTWIKDFTRQLSRDNYLDLTFHQRGILHGIRLEYARGGAHVIAADTRRLTHRLGARVTMRDLRALEKAGFIELRDAPANHAADTRRQRDVNAADTRQTTDRHLTDASTHTTGPPNQATHDENTPASSQQKGQQPARVQENQEIQKNQGLNADRSEARGLSADKQNELNRILELAHDRDAGSWNILYDAARGLPFAALAKVRESCMYEQSTSGRVGVGYAVNALRSEPRVLRDAASFADFLEEEAS